jgi:hypothetical protein
LVDLVHIIGEGFRIQAWDLDLDFRRCFFLSLLGVVSILDIGPLCVLPFPFLFGVFLQFFRAFYKERTPLN